MESRQYDIESNFAIEIDYQKGVGDPARIFRAMTGIIETFQIFDRNLVGVIDPNIEPLIVMDEIEAGSLRGLFRDVLRAIPDDAIYHLDPRPIFGQVLLVAKKMLIDFTNGKNTITSIQDVNDLIDKLNELTDQSQMKMLPSYKPIKPMQVLDPMVHLSGSLANFDEKDKAMYFSRYGNADFNIKFNLTAEIVEDLIAKNTLIGEDEMILRVKRPDFLGESMWEFKHGPTPIAATIEDKDWLKQFQTRQIELRPQDAIKAIVKTIRKYDYDDELIAEHHSLIRITDIVHGPEQKSMF
jgi:hypothetical protein